MSIHMPSSPTMRVDPTRRRSRLRGAVTAAISKTAAGADPGDDRRNTQIPNTSAQMYRRLAKWQNSEPRRLASDPEYERTDVAQHV